MNTTNNQQPDPDTVPTIPPPWVMRAHFRTLTRFLYGAYEEAHGKATDYLRAQEATEVKRKIDARLYNEAVRYHVQNYLHRENIRTQIWEETQTKDFESDVLPSSGIAGRYNGCEYRVLKAARDGILPPPGRSWVKKRYYEQIDFLQSSLFLPLNPDEPRWPNVIFLWQVANNVLTLYIVCPKGGNEYQAFAHWIEPIPHPVFDIQSDTDDGAEKEEDIEIRKKVEEKSKDDDDLR